MKLVNYNAKVSKEFRDMTSAIVDVTKSQGISSQRELLEAMLESYSKENPEIIARAISMVALKNMENDVIYKGGQ